MPIVKERRRFTDVMEEEQLTKVDKRTLAMGREDFSIYKLHRGEEVEVKLPLCSASVALTFFHVWPIDI